MSSKKRINRRQFVKLSGSAIGGALVFPTIIPAKVFAKSGNTAPNNKIIVGCIGVGGMGMGNMRGFLQKEEAQVVAGDGIEIEVRPLAQIYSIYGSIVSNRRACKSADVVVERRKKDGQGTVQDVEANG